MLCEKNPTLTLYLSAVLITSFCLEGMWVKIVQRVHPDSYGQIKRGTNICEKEETICLQSKNLSSAFEYCIFFY